MLSLKSGDTFSCSYSESDVLIAIVDTIKISGTTVTITEGKTEIEDVFECVKIECEGSNSNDYSMDTSDISEGVTPINPMKSRAINSRAIEEDEYPFSQSFSVSVDLKGINKDNTDTDDNKNEDNKFDVDSGFKASGTVTFSAKVTEFNVYLSGISLYLNTTIDRKTDFLMALVGEVEHKLKIPKIRFFTVAGVNITFTPRLVLSASASVEVNVTMYDKHKFSCSAENGFQNESEKTYTESSLDFNGKVFLGVSLEFACNVICEEFAEASLTILAGLKMSGNLLSTKIEEDSRHNCGFCITGELCFKLV